MSCALVPTVTAIIPVFRPPGDRLLNCINGILRQVDDIIVSVDVGGKLPFPEVTGENLRFIHRTEGQNSYGQNVNFAAKHTTSEFLWFLNDDFFAGPECAVAMLDMMSLHQDAGMVGHLILYPDGHVCHAGKYRNPGMREWKHLTQSVPSLDEIAEMEVVTGTSCLARRAAHEAIGGFDPDFQFYSEDDDYCLRLRQAGYKIIYTPFCSGVHEEGQSTTATGRRKEWEAKGHELMNRKWGWWFDKNRDTIPGTF